MMAEAGERPEEAQSSRLGLWQPVRAVLENPVVSKELRGRMRGRRAFVVLTAYLLLLSCFTSALYYAYGSAAQQPYGLDSYLIGKIVFGGVVGMQLLMVIFITPAFTAGTITGEKERQTYDLLRTTLLSARSLVLGKLTAALAYVVLLILAAVPLESLAFLLGGVAIEEVVISQVILLATALSLAVVSINVSSRAKSTLSATVLSYAYALMATGGLPALAMVLAPLLGLAGNAMTGQQEPHWLVMLLLVYLAGFLLSINPFSTIILSEVVLIQEQTVFFFRLPLSSVSPSYPDIWLVSPWAVYVLFFGLVALLGYWICVRRVRQVGR